MNNPSRRHHSSKSKFVSLFAGAALLVAGLELSCDAFAQSAASANSNSPPAESFELPKSVPDPIEPFNRVMWSVNQGVMRAVVRPTARVYRTVVIKPLRTGISNLAKNLTYPARLMNNLLQGQWNGAGDETARFLCNSTLGIGGIFAVGDKWNIPKSEADLGQTFAKWGWRPGCYLMLPIFGPSNERDTIGLAGDLAAQPLVYFSPYAYHADDPATIFSPYTYFNSEARYNDLSDSVDEYVRFSKAEMDPYAQLQYGWTFVRSVRAPDTNVHGPQDASSLETLNSTKFTFGDPEFLERAKSGSVLIPSTRKKLEFSYWLQPKSAPMVYVIPGLGSHRLAFGAIALAELAYKKGFAAVCVSSTFNSEFMEHASSAALPAYLPTDAHDLHVALTEIDQQFSRRLPNRIRSRAILGYSMGALQLLHIAVSQPENPSLVHFDRFVAIDTPVRMLHGIEKLDEFYRAPLEWPAAERTSNIENTFLKLAAASRNSSTTNSPTPPPFSAIESKFLVGLNFRIILRDIIYSSQRRDNFGVLTHSLRSLRREPVYHEIMNYSYADYFQKFAIPYYDKKGLPGPALELIGKAGDLRTYEATLKTNPSIRVLVNQNDFLLGDGDLAWLRATFSPDKLTVFEHGGHLGNLPDTEVQKKILAALEF